MSVSCPASLAHVFLMRILHLPLEPARSFTTSKNPCKNTSKDTGTKVVRTSQHSSFPPKSS
ncbi:hypothetical protein E2C01_091554 [Portunus trituberculatus]|uniref:Uncharacterized protein n=1 Tax=Portunus trituberculatus TaxID=210409 RepID=A0A5B7JPD3_PORTR|nr:hypothetical protein [Portunus trituberculatus]